MRTPTSLRSLLPRLVSAVLLVVAGAAQGHGILVEPLVDGAGRARLAVTLPEAVGDVQHAIVTVLTPGGDTVAARVVAGGAIVRLPGLVAGTYAVSVDGGGAERATEMTVLEARTTSGARALLVLAPTPVPGVVTELYAIVLDGSGHVHGLVRLGGDGPDGERLEAVTLRHTHFAGGAAEADGGAMADHASVSFAAPGRWSLAIEITSGLPDRATFELEVAP